MMIVQRASRLRWALIAVAASLACIWWLGANVESILLKLLTVGTATIFAHLLWETLFPYVGLNRLLEDARSSGQQSAATVFLGAVVLRSAFYLAVILGFCIGL